MKKKGVVHNAGAVGGLIGLIALFLVLYIVFLPPEEREALLEMEEIEDAEERVRILNNTLLEKTVGRLEFYPPAFDHFIPSVYLFEKRESTLIEKINPFFIQNSWFSKKPYATQFIIDDLENTENVILAFSSPVHKGPLKITLNDQEIYNYPLERELPPPIDLKSSLLKKINTLQFEVGGVGLRLWDRNQYSFENVQIIGDITDRSRQKAQNVFTITGTEQANLLTAGMFFVPSCNPNDVGLLSILVNGRSIYSAIPDCQTTNFIELDVNYLREGANNIIFETTQGKYMIENIKVQTNLKEVRTFVEYFEVIPELYDDVLDDRKDIILEIDFIDDGKRKRAQLNINGHLTFIDQREPFYTRNIDTWVVPGTRNYIEIVPETALNIPEVRVVVD